MNAPQPVANTTELVITIGEEVKELQAQMQKLFLKQKEKGGIIDLEVKLIIIQNVNIMPIRSAAMTIKSKIRYVSVRFI